MRVPLSWLREMCPTDLSAEELAELLTRKGAEVEEILRPWAGLAGVTVARVLEVRDHPGSDRLCVVRVDGGDGESEVVAGVRNMAVGDLVSWARPGSRIPALPEPLGRRELRGVASNGMLCSPRELAVGPDHDRILILSPEEAAVADDVAEAFGLDDEVLDISVTPNRPDLMSVEGVAREVAAATGTPFTAPDATVNEIPDEAEKAATVDILEPERCPLYVARVIRDVRVGHSPVRAQARLTACGMRPLSNVVDATNYVMLEMGHPLHPFDMDLLAGPGIVVRRADEGETFVTLDDQERILTEDDLMIADLERAVAIGGVMGGEHGEVSQATTNVLLESAHFERTGIARTSRRLDLRTEASARFERGADPEGTHPAAARAAALIAAWSGGSVLAGTAEAGGIPPRRRVRVREERASAVLGHEMTARVIREALGRIRIEAEEVDEGLVEAEVPGFRPDIEREIDLIEEAIRVAGYDLVGTTLPAIRQPGGVPAAYAFRRRVRTALSSGGLHETRSYSFASEADLELTGDGPGILLANPLSAEERFLRGSLLPGILRALQANAAKQVLTVGMFEVGTVFHHADPVEEHERAAFGLFGPVRLEFPQERREPDFFDAKGLLELLLCELGVRDWALGDTLGRPYHPTRSAEVLVGGSRVGAIGELAPRIAEQFDLAGGAVIGELALAPLLSEATSVAIAYREIPRFPPVRRDLAFVVPVDVAAGPVRTGLLEASGGLAESVYLFDVFTGGPVPDGMKSLAFSVDFRAPDRTLTDGEVEEVVLRIATSLREVFGAELRAG